jgi:hypothetical protein
VQVGLTCALRDPVHREINRLEPFVDHCDEGFVCTHTPSPNASGLHG